jgi:putative ABC transport system ATP-binding protein
VETVVLHDLDLAIQEKEFVAILGPSGCGKTTLLNLLGGLERPTSGSILAGNRELTRLSSEELNHYRKTEVAFIFQFYNLFSTLTATENVRVGIDILGLSKRESDERARHYLDAVGLGSKTRHLPSRLSGGEQQRVAIARALAKRAPLILADEPTGNLDQETGVAIMKLFAQIHEKGDATIVMITHDLNVAAGASRTVKLLNGRIQEGARS